MRKLIITQNVTIDGAVDMQGDWFEPQGQADMEDLLEEMRRQDSQADAILLGRKTFESFRDYWRDLEGDATGVSDYLNGVRKHVVSTTIDDPDWEGTTVIRGDAVEAARALKEQPGRDIVLTGSVSLAHTLIAAGLVDEYRSFIYPVAQPAGRRLFPEEVGELRLELLESRAFRSGIVLTRHAAR